MQSGKNHSPGNCQTQTLPSDCQTEKHDWSLQTTRLHCTRVQWRPLSFVFPICFHFVIIPLTVDRGIFSSKEIPWMDLLHRW
ncbi:unnamed protein product [Staurois parvus]|uniref:Uncharacterized protein n=1 Tax=Staurois parvus TaxID=386267 RepID=A0ABN9ERJ9_9NEOB|nr:unnamed protein product [Staurois parvus]